MQVRVRPRTFPLAARYISGLLPHAAAIAAILFIALAPVRAQDQNEAYQRLPVEKLNVLPGYPVIPPSNHANAQDLGKRMHTNLRLLLPTSTSPLELPPYGGYGYETPASLACVYSLVATIPGCDPNSTVNTPTGGSQTIAIVDAYDDPEAAPDLAYFSDQFGIPFSPSMFQVVYASGYQPPVDYTGGWELEEALDVEYAHAMAPKAMLYLVEASSNSNYDLMTAVSVAANLVRCGKTATCPTNATGKGEVSMSWGGAEFSGETVYDSNFSASNVVFLAAVGDSAGTLYPSASPNVISVGGTSTARGLYSSKLILEIVWADGGGGVSPYELRPSYQSGIATIAGTHRALPDVAADANLNTGVWVYDSFPMNYSYPGNWWTVGGTSVATPIWAGILNAASTANGSFAASSAAELTKLYGDLASTTNYPKDFNDITYGACGPYSALFAVKGYDLCTGIGSPKTYLGK